MPSYSKAPRGLFVQVELGRVFTAIAISPSRGSRQLLTRDAIRAGRNLPDKELRYRRTVIVTAAVYRSLTLLHFAQKTQYIKLKTKYYFKYSVFSIKSFVRSTTPLNLPALGRRQPVYLRLTLLHGPVFLINSRLAIISCDLAPCTRNIKSNT